MTDECGIALLNLVDQSDTDYLEQNRVLRCTTLSVCGMLLVMS